MEESLVFQTHFESFFSHHTCFETSMNDVKEAFGKHKNVTLFLFVEANDTLGIVFNPRFHLLAPDVIYVMRTFMKFSDAASLFP